MTLRRRGSSIGLPVKSCGGLDDEELYSRAIHTIDTPDSNAQGEKLPEGASDFKVKARFERELPDASWAPGAEESIRSMVNTQSLGSAFSSTTVECRSSLCQVRAWADPAALANLKPPPNDPWNETMRRVGEAFEVVHLRIGPDDGDRNKMQFVATVRRRHGP
jgi:hypothetical protein